jgi:hypothetical protein
VLLSAAAAAAAVVVVVVVAVVAGHMALWLRFQARQLGKKIVTPPAPPVAARLPTSDLGARFWVPVPGSGSGAPAENPDERRTTNGVRGRMGLAWGWQLTAGMWHGHDISTEVFGRAYLEVRASGGLFYALNHPVSPTKRPNAKRKSKTKAFFGLPADLITSEHLPHHHLGRPNPPPLARLAPTRRF